MWCNFCFVLFFYRGHYGVPADVFLPLAGCLSRWICLFTLSVLVETFSYLYTFFTLDLFGCL